MNKKIISGILAGALSLSAMGMNVFATAQPTSHTYAVSALVEMPTLTVTLPANVEVAINPFGLTKKYNESTVDAEKTNGIKTQILSPTYEITNGSEVGVNVSITVTGTVKGDVKLAESGTFADSKKKDVFMYIKGGADADTAGGAYAEDTDIAITTKEQTKILMDIAAKDTADKKAYLKVNGALNTAAEDEWTEKDGVSLKLIIKVTPKVATT